MKLWKLHITWVGVCGIILSLASLYGIILIAMEMSYEHSVNNRYEIDTESLSKPNKNSLTQTDQPDSSPLQYKNNKVKVILKPKKEVKKSVIVSNEFKESIFVGEIELYLNDKPLDQLNNRLLVRPYSDHGEEPFPLQEHDISIFILKDRETKQNQLMILEEISNYEVRDETYLNYKYYRDGMEETKMFRLWKVKDDGSYTKEEFYGYKGTRTYLQTHILQSFGYPIVQYTDLLDRFFIVLPFPLFLCITEVIGLILIIIGMERKYWMD